MKRWEKVPQFYEQQVLDEQKIKQEQQSKYPKKQKLSLKNIQDELIILPRLKSFSTSLGNSQFVKYENNKDNKELQQNHIIELDQISRSTSISRIQQKSTSNLLENIHQRDLALRQIQSRQQVQKNDQFFSQVKENIDASQKLYYPSENIFIKWSQLNGRFPQKQTLCLPDEKKDENYFATFQLKKFNSFK